MSITTIPDLAQPAPWPPVANRQSPKQFGHGSSDDLPGVGVGRNPTEQAAGAAAVSDGLFPWLAPGSSGDRLSLSPRLEHAHLPQKDAVSSKPAVSLGVDTGYGPDARPLAGAAFDHEADRKDGRRELDYPAQDQTRNPEHGFDPEQASSRDNAAKAESKTTEHTSEDKTKPEFVDENELSLQERQLLEELRQRDAEVRAHEQAHIAAGGQHVRGGANYTYQTGPDGRQYAVGGEVSIDASPVPGNPELTEQKAQAVRRAALAPAAPSAQDIKVAASASQMEAEARLAKLQATQEEQDQEGALQSSSGQFYQETSGGEPTPSGSADIPTATLLTTKHPQARLFAAPNERNAVLHAYLRQFDPSLL